MSALLNSLTEAELALVRETEPDRLAMLDEDDLVELHTRIRRARTKYVGLYRREASAKVAEYGGRGKSRPKNQRNAAKAEVFEEALARVSRSLSVAARRSATELKAERIAAARAERNTTPPRTTRPKAAPAKAQRASTRPDSPALRKRHASTRAVGARRQVRKDSK
ncbi:hypothetical protein F4553_002180 [Allocatelliglobosispora scoriae]|uniref:Uncharacterized protein n=1 Tax=Allocatelliglobosispora scoriae TaxID=643052 RepID=A0A841BPP3_9ACTN|nr:hypothetical protein [Allocatelliglobosispora scoriae]MBB5868801.1 hypothetical protein [Allocatelliglobosispora scoriae]